MRSSFFRIRFGFDPLSDGVWSVPELSLKSLNLCCPGRANSYYSTSPHLSPQVDEPTVSRFSQPNLFAVLKSDDSDDEDCYHTPLLCSVTPSPILADSGATHVIPPREFVLPSLAHLMRPATLPPMPFTLPNGSILTAQ
jgi:hypothetical protein